MVRRILLLILAVAVPLSLVLSAPALPASADDSAPTLSPTQGPPGTSVTASAADWTGCSSMSVSGWGGTLGTAAINSAGAFSLPFTVPSNAPTGAAQLMFSPTCTHSTISPFVTFTVTAPGIGMSVPAAPSNLTVTAVDQHDIRLNWQGNSSNETGFEINNGVVSRDAGANSATYTWGGLAPGTYMCFKIRAYNSAGDSAWEPDVSPWYRCTTTPALPPGSPIYICSNSPRIDCVTTSNWAGYSYVEKTGPVRYVEGTWVVPNVTFPCLLYPASDQVAVWAGLWGSVVTLAQDWLPQIGTESSCSVPNESLAVWSMPHPADGTAYLLQGKTWVPENTAGGEDITIENFSVSPGDTMDAGVYYDSTLPGDQRVFQLTLDDVSRGESVSLYVKTSPGVALGNIDNQGGIIIENSSGLVPLPFPHFSPPVKVHFAVEPSVDASEPSSSGWINEFLMPNVKVSGLDAGGKSFTATWQSS
jgi:hypothetical protein